MTMPGDGAHHNPAGAFFPVVGPVLSPGGEVPAIHGELGPGTAVSGNRRQGCVVQQGTPHDVYFHPASAWVARFLGLSNLAPGRVVAVEPEPGGGTTAVVRSSLGEMALHSMAQFGLGQEIMLLIRPEAARLAGEPPAEGEFTITIEGVVRGCSFRGRQTRLEVHHSPDLDLVFEVASGGQRLPEIGESIVLALPPEAINVLAEEPHDQTASD